MQTFTNEGWIATKDACSFLSLPLRVLARLVREGHLPHGKGEKGRLRYCLSDLRRIAEDEEVKRTLTASKWFGQVHSERTKTALQHQKAQGVKLGAPALSNEATLARIKELRGDGLTLRVIASTLTAEGHKTQRGGTW